MGLLVRSPSPPAREPRATLHRWEHGAGRRGRVGPADGAGERPGSGALARPGSSGAGRPGSAASQSGPLFAGPAEQSRPIKWNDFVQVRGVHITRSAPLRLRAGIEAYEGAKGRRGRRGAGAPLGRMLEAKEERQRAAQPEGQARAHLFAPPAPSPR
eukprot:tig00021098_g18184.t1